MTGGMAEFGAAMLFRAYEFAGCAAMPFLPVALSMRAARGKEDRARIGERFGKASLARPAGRLIWVHAASVGEWRRSVSDVSAARPDAGRRPREKFYERSYSVWDGDRRSRRRIWGPTRQPPYSRLEGAPIGAPRGVGIGYPKGGGEPTLCDRSAF